MLLGRASSMKGELLNTPNQAPQRAQQRAAATNAGGTTRHLYVSTFWSSYTLATPDGIERPSANRHASAQDAHLP